MMLELVGKFVMDQVMSYVFVDFALNRWIGSKPDGSDAIPWVLE